MKNKLYIIIPIFAVFISSFFIFTSLDNKIFDIFLRTLPSLEENDSVLLINVDDEAIERVGLFPWTRDILADAIVFLREMGADSVIFDLSYLDNSPMNINPQYIREELPRYIDYGFNQIDSNITDVMNAFGSNMIDSGDASSFRDELIAGNKAVRNSIDTSLAYVTRDIDEYFANTLRFFGNSYLTLTMISLSDLIDPSSGEVNFEVEDLPWIEENIALDNITSQNDTKTPLRIGMIPAISKLLRSSNGAGVVNAEPDKDGYRRRIHLLSNFNDKYYGQLTFVPLLERLGNPAVTVSNSNITLENVVLSGETKNIVIPRDEDGSIIIKWPKKEYMDYNIMSSWSLIGYNMHEDAFIKNLEGMNESGFFAYWDEAESPLDKYNNAQYIRDTLYEGEKPEEGITFDTYLQFRKEYIEAADRFLNNNYENLILADVAGDEQLSSFVSDFFGETRKQYGELVEMRKNVSAKVDNAFCIIGVDATSMTDSGLTTFQERFPNVGIHAVVVNQILAGEFLDDSSPWISIIIAFILSIAVGILSKKLDSQKSLFAGIGILIFSVLILLLIFIMTKVYIGVIVPFTAVTFSFLTLSGLSFFTTIREKSFLRSAFSRYLSPEVISEIIADPSKLNLGGEKKELTAMFTDIKGFSTISEKMDPTDLVALLNRYLTEMSNIILENKGTIDKYEGDAIIAFFGAPISFENHATLACRSAILMKRAEVNLNKYLVEENINVGEIFTRIGVNTGDMIVGNMGTPNKMDYTIMGNAVNLAARLEGVNKQYHTKGILISEYTRSQIGDEEFILRRLDRVRVVGINTPLRLYELLELAEDCDDKTRKLNSLWETAIDYYENRNFPSALDCFTNVAEEDTSDKVVNLYIERCHNFIKTQPDAEWDGVFNLIQK